MPYNDQDKIAIRTTGSTEAEFVSVTFKASVTTYAPTGPAAKAKAKGQIDEIKAVIARFATPARIETDRLRTSFSVDVHRNYNSHTFDGYKAVYTIAFTGKNISEATGLHDALTSINGVESPTPVFNVDDSPEVVARVFEDATKKARRTFTDQCKVLGFDPSTFEISRWWFEPNHRAGGKFLALETDEGKNIEVSPGRAILESTYQFEFRAK